MEKTKLGIKNFLAMKEEDKKITMVTAYDFAFMSRVNRADIDLVLVGDSAAMTMLGHPNTVPVDIDTMILLSQAVVRGGDKTFIIGDMPFMSYEVSVEKAIENAGRLIKEGLVDAVKLEGGERMAETVAAITRAGIPVMGHIGLTPQSAQQLGGFQVQGRSLSDAMQIFKDAMALEKAGIFSLLIEAVPTPLARLITDTIKVPTVGIGAGNGCDGQVLVIHDMLGLFDRFTPKFVKKYASLGEEMEKALNSYAAEVRGGQFPGKEHSFSMPAEVEEDLKNQLRQEGLL